MMSAGIGVSCSKPNSVVFRMFLVLIISFSSLFAIEAFAQDTPCEIWIFKEAIPADNTPFEFEFDNFAGHEQIILQDPSTDFFARFVNLDSMPSNAVVTEIVTPGWVLANIFCEFQPGFGTGSFTISGSTVTTGLCDETTDAARLFCTYTNVREDGCNLEIVKEAIPAEDTPFVFNVSAIVGESSFVLQDPSDPSFDLTVRVPGDSVSEDVPEGWTLFDVSCETEEGLGVEIVDNVVTVTECNIDAPEPASGRCVFANINPDLKTIPTLSEWGLIVMAVLLGAAVIYAVRKRLLAN